MDTCLVHAMRGLAPGWTPGYWSAQDDRSRRIHWLGGSKLDAFGCAEQRNVGAEGSRCIASPMAATLQRRATCHDACSAFWLLAFFHSRAWNNTDVGRMECAEAPPSLAQWWRRPEASYFSYHHPLLTIPLAWPVGTMQHAAIWTSQAT